MNPKFYNALYEKSDTTQLAQDQIIGTASAADINTVLEFRLWIAAGQSSQGTAKTAKSAKSTRSNDRACTASNCEDYEAWESWMNIINIGSTDYYTLPSVYYKDGKLLANWITGPSSSETNVESSVAINEETWYDVAVKVSNSEITIYVDGVETSKSLKSGTYLSLPTENTYSALRQK